MKSNLLHPRVTDNDRDEITVTLNGKELRGWSYSSDQERRVKMLCAREYVEGFCALSDIAERMAEISSTFLDAVDDLCDWMNGNDLAADHSEARPKDFDRLCTAMEGMRSALSAFKDAGR